MLKNIKLLLERANLVIQYYLLYFLPAILFKSLLSFGGGFVLLVVLAVFSASFSCSSTASNTLVGSICLPWMLA